MDDKLKMQSLKQDFDFDLHVDGTWYFWMIP